MNPENLPTSPAGEKTPTSQPSLPAPAAAAPKGATPSEESAGSSSSGGPGPEEAAAQPAPASAPAPLPPRDPLLDQVHRIARSVQQGAPAAATLPQALDELERLLVRPAPPSQGSAAAADAPREPDPGSLRLRLRSIVEALTGSRAADESSVLALLESAQTALGAAASSPPDAPYAVPKQLAQLQSGVVEVKQQLLTLSSLKDRIRESDAAVRLHTSTIQRLLDQLSGLSLHPPALPGEGRGPLDLAAVQQAVEGGLGKVQTDLRGAAQDIAETSVSKAKTELASAAQNIVDTSVSKAKTEFASAAQNIAETSVSQVKTELASVAQQTADLSITSAANSLQERAALITAPVLAQQKSLLRWMLGIGSMALVLNLALWGYVLVMSAQRPAVLPSQSHDGGAGEQAAAAGSCTTPPRDVPAERPINVNAWCSSFMGGPAAPPFPPKPPPKKPPKEPPKDPRTRLEECARK